MASLSNYLRTNRRRLALSQEEVGFLIGINGEGKGIKVSRDEHSARVPDLRTALAYEAVYGRPIRELFAGMYENIEQEVVGRANVLRHRKTGKPRTNRQETINSLASKII